MKHALETIIDPALRILPPMMASRRAKVAIGNTVLYAIIAGLVVLFYLGASKIKGN